MFGGFECLAQPAYVHVDRPFLDKDVIAPDFVEQLGAAVDALRMGHEEMQHPELGRPQSDVATGGADAMRDRIEPEVRDLDAVPQERDHQRLDQVGEVAMGHLNRLGELANKVRSPEARMNLLRLTYLLVQTDLARLS